jgi:CHAD domain-containing protein
VAGAPERRAPLARTLDESRERAARWRLPQAWHPVLVQGVERIYRRGRKALRIAAASATDRNLHEWRKQVKRLGAALDMVAPLSPRRAAKAAKKINALGAELGDDRDFALLCCTDALDEPLLVRVRGRRGRLQASALEQGHRLYSRKPRAFIARLLG